MSIAAMLDEVRRHVQPSDLAVGDSRFWLAVPDNQYTQTFGRSRPRPLTRRLVASKRPTWLSRATP